MKQTQRYGQANRQVTKELTQTVARIFGFNKNCNICIIFIDRHKLAHCWDSVVRFYGHIIKAFCFCFVVFDFIAIFVSLTFGSFSPFIFLYAPTRLLVFTPWLMTKTFTSAGGASGVQPTNQPSSFPEAKKSRNTAGVGLFSVGWFYLENSTLWDILVELIIILFELISVGKSASYLVKSFA